MNIVFKTSFLRDLKKIKIQQTLDQIKIAIEVVEKSHTTSDIPNIKQIKGAKNHDRIRIGSYRIGIAINDEIAMSECSHQPNMILGLFHATNKHKINNA